MGSVNATQGELEGGEARLSPNEAIVVGCERGNGRRCLCISMYVSLGEEATRKKSLFSCVCVVVSLSLAFS